MLFAGIVEIVVPLAVLNIKQYENTYFTSISQNPGRNAFGCLFTIKILQSFKFSIITVDAFAGGTTMSPSKFDSEHDEGHAATLAGPSIFGVRQVWCQNCNNILQFIPKNKF